MGCGDGGVGVGGEWDHGVDIWWWVMTFMERLRETAEFAIKLSSGLLVTRDPLRAGSGAIDRARKIHIVSPGTPPVEADKIAAFKPIDISRDTDTFLQYRRRGKAAHIDEIWSGKLKTHSKRNSDALKIQRTIIPHLDHRGLNTTTIAQAHGGDEIVPTAKLARSYSKQGFRVDREKIRRVLSEESNPWIRNIKRHDMTHRAIPMIRQPSQES